MKKNALKTTSAAAVMPKPKTQTIAPVEVSSGVVRSTRAREELISNLLDHIHLSHSVLWDLLKERDLKKTAISVKRHARTRHTRPEKAS